MASTSGYPKVSSKAWATLRSRAAAAPSTKFTPPTVAALLGMSSPKSAADNVVYPIRRLGLVDEDGALTERGNKWRVDSSYPEACEEILKECYPEDLSALVDADGAPDKSQVNLWLQHKGFGGSNANSMAATYVLIASKTPPNAAPPSDAKKATAKKVPKPVTAAATAPKPAIESTTDPATQSSGAVAGASGPVIHLDIQIHIPAAATADQIDQIFSSMAKHLYQR